MSKVKLNSVKLDVKVEPKVDNRKNNPGRPVNKQSARYKRLQKQSFYNRVNNKFKKGNQFRVNDNTYYYKPDNNGGCIYSYENTLVCVVDYVGRTKVTGFTYVLGKRVNVELNLKTLQFVSNVTKYK